MSAEESDSDARTLYVAGLSEKVTEKILYELFYQVICLFHFFKICY